MNYHKIKEEIAAGSMVFLDPDQSDAAARERVLGWIESYGQGPFKVYTRSTEHVILHNAKDKPINFGSSCWPQLHIAYVRLAENSQDEVPE